MVEPAGCPRLLFETAQTISIRRESRWQYLDRYFTSNSAVFGVVDLSHASGAQQGENFVGAELLSRHDSDT